PEICIEVLSDRNTRPEIERKAALYFARGAKEVWVCDEGRMSSYVGGIGLDVSQLAPKFPATGSAATMNAECRVNAALSTNKGDDVAS
ncbi:MAG: hypothetical protein ACREXR_07505, partial [Gammaproteobacteria bacterium]